MPSTYGITRRNVLVGAVGAVGVRAHGAAAPAARNAKPLRWQIGCYTRPWGKEDYRVALDGIAEAGYKHAGLMTTKSTNRMVISMATTPEEAGRIAEEVKKRELEVPSVYGGGIGVTRGLKAGIANLRKLIDSCAVVGAKSLLMGWMGNKEHYEAYYKVIAECCDYAAAKKLEIVVKPHGGLNATGPQCRDAVKLVNHENFHVWYDAGNILFYSQGKLDPVEDAAAVDGLVTGLCVKDYLPPKNVLVAPGSGKVDFPGVLKRLIQGGFKGGPLVVETLPPGDAKATVAEAIKARTFLENLVRQVA